MVKRFVIMAALAGATIAPVWAEESISDWGSSGDWRVRINAAAGNGCFIEKDFDDGIQMRFGFLPAQEGGFISATSEAWTDLTAGQTGIVKFFTSEEKFAGEVEMIEQGARRGGQAFFNNPAFLIEVAKRNSLRVVGPSGREFEIALKGSAKAITEMERCQAEQG